MCKYEENNTMAYYNLCRIQLTCIKIADKKPMEEFNICQRCIKSNIIECSSDNEFLKIKFKGEGKNK